MIFPIREGWHRQPVSFPPPIFSVGHENKIKSPWKPKPKFIANANITGEYLNAFHVHCSLWHLVDQSKEASDVVQALTKLKGKTKENKQTNNNKTKTTQGITFTTKTSLGCPIPFHDYLVYYPRGFTELLVTVDMITKQDFYSSPYNRYWVQCSCSYKNKIINNFFSWAFQISSDCARFYYKNGLNCHTLHNVTL